MLETPAPSPSVEESRELYGSPEKTSDEMTRISALVRQVDVVDHFASRYSAVQKRIDTSSEERRAPLRQDRDYQIAQGILSGFTAEAVAPARQILTTKYGFTEADFEGISDGALVNTLFQLVGYPSFVPGSIGKYFQTQMPQFDGKSRLDLLRTGDPEDFQRIRERDIASLGQEA